MKFTIVLVLSFMFTAFAHADDIKFKTLNEARAAFYYHVMCSSRSGSPQVHVTYSNGNGANGVPAGAIALVIPGEGLFVRNWPYVPSPTMIPAWTLGATLNPLVLSGRFETPSLETITLTIQDSTNGRYFNGRVDFSNYGGGVSLNRDVRCTITNYLAIP